MEHYNEIVKARDEQNPPWGFCWRVITVRLSLMQHNAAKRGAAARGMNLSEYIRYLIDKEAVGHE